MTTFELLEDHILLLQNMELEYNSYTEYGGPRFDPKRPFGWSGRWSILQNMAEILGYDERKVNKDDEMYDDEVVYYLESVYQETATALKIILQTRSFVPGEYKRRNIDGEWEPWKLMKTIPQDNISEFN